MELLDVVLSDPLSLNPDSVRLPLIERDELHVLAGQRVPIAVKVALDAAVAVPDAKSSVLWVHRASDYRLSDDLAISRGVHLRVQGDVLASIQHVLDELEDALVYERPLHRVDFGLEMLPVRVFQFEHAVLRLVERVQYADALANFLDLGTLLRIERLADDLLDSFGPTQKVGVETLGAGREVGIGNVAQLDSFHWASYAVVLSVTSPSPARAVIKLPSAALLPLAPVTVGFKEPVPPKNAIRPSDRILNSTVLAVFWTCRALS